MQNAKFFTVSNIGSKNRTAYAFVNTETGERYYRAGCWFSNEESFLRRIRDEYGNDQHGIEYAAMVDFARARFACYEKKEKEEPVND